MFKSISKIRLLVLICSVFLQMSATLSSPALGSIDPNSEEDSIVDSTSDPLTSTNYCSPTSGVWEVIDQPTFSLTVDSQPVSNIQMPSLEGLTYPEDIARAFEFSRATNIEPFLTYPLAINISKGPESANGQGGTVFSSGGAIFSTPQGNIVTGALRFSNNSNNNPGSFSTVAFECPAPFNVAPTNCHTNGLYKSEGGSLGIRALDVRNNLYLMIMEDNVFRETANSGNAMEKIADLNTQLLKSFGGTFDRILVSDTYYNRNVAGQAIIATAIARMSNGTFRSAIIQSVGSIRNNGENWTLDPSNLLYPSDLSISGLPSNANIWITSLAVSNKFDSATSNSDPMVIVSGYTNVGSGPSSWFIARKNLNSGTWTTLELNQTTAGRFTSVNRTLLTEKGELYVAGQLQPGVNGVTSRKGILRKFLVTPSSFQLLDQNGPFDGQAYDVGLGDYDGTIIASTTQGTTPTAMRRLENASTWTQLPSVSMSGFGYEIQSDDQGRIYWAVQDGSQWKLLRLSCEK